MSFTKLFELFEGACQYEIHYPAISRDLTAKECEMETIILADFIAKD